jgi:hypothetical protein
MPSLNTVIEEARLQLAELRFQAGRRLFVTYLTSISETVTFCDKSDTLVLEIGFGYRRCQKKYFTKI